MRRWTWMALPWTVLGVGQSIAGSWRIAVIDFAIGSALLAVPFAVREIRARGWWARVFGH